MKKKKTPACRALEPMLVAVATDEASTEVRRRVEAHVSGCSECKVELDRYRRIEGGLSSLREEPAGLGIEQSMARVQSRVEDLRHRLVRYGIFPSPFGSILLARSEAGVLLVEYLGSGHSLAASRLSRLHGIEPLEDDRAVQPLRRDLTDYLARRRTRLEWPLDFRLVHSEFHRAILERTAAIPYGGVMSYSGVAKEVGRPSAVRATAQALRWNPLPIVIPCHRVVGSTGALTGYAGGTTEKKKKLLGIEGVPTAPARDDFSVRRDGMYIIQPSDDEYCLPTCPGVRSLDKGSTLVASRQGAEELGLRPCHTCRPDLHPLHA